MKHRVRLFSYLQHHKSHIWPYTLTLVKLFFEVAYLHLLKSYFPCFMNVAAFVSNRSIGELIAPPFKLVDRFINGFRT